MRHHERHEEAASADENVCGVWTPVHMAQEMGEELGRREVLQRALPQTPEQHKIQQHLIYC
ncbi:MAG: hypothetical protein AAFR56_21795 [Chloroflexota bacterium]